MEKRRFFDLLYILMIVALIIFLVWIVYFLKGNARECLADPITYFEEKNDGAICNCYKDGIGYRENRDSPIGEFILNLSEFEE